MEEKKPAPKTEEELKKSLYIIKSDKFSLVSAENYLKNREWELGSSDDIRQAMVYILNKKPTYVMVTVDHNNSKVDKLPGLLKQTFPVKVIIFAESHSSKSLHKLRSLNHPYTLMPPISGPMIERMINKITRDEERKDKIGSDGDKKKSSYRSNSDSDVISIKNSNKNETYHQRFNSSSKDNSKVVINQDRKKHDNSYINQETKSSDGRGNSYFDSNQEGGSYSSSSSESYDNSGSFQQDGPNSSNGSYFDKNAQNDDNNLLNQEGKDHQNNMLNQQQEKEQQNDLLSQQGKEHGKNGSSLQSKEDSKQSKYKQQQEALKGKGNSDLQQSKNKNNSNKLNQTKQKDKSSDKTNESSNKEDSKNNNHQSSAKDKKGNYNDKNAKNDDGNYSDQNSNKKDLNKNNASKDDKKEKNNLSNSDKAKDKGGSLSSDKKKGNTWEALEHEKNQDKAKNSDGQNKELNKNSDGSADKENSKDDLNNPFSRQSNGINKRSDKVHGANNKSKSGLNNKTDKKNKNKSSKTSAKDKGKVSSALQTKAKDQNSNSLQNGLKKNKKGAGLYSSVLEEATQEALDTSSNAGTSTNVKSLAENSNFTCISVNSQTYNGYLLAASSSNQHLDDKFIKVIKERVVKFLESKGEQINDQNDLEIKVEKVNYPSWSEEEAEFFRRSIHKGEEVGMAFFENHELKEPLYIKESDDMICLSIDDIVEDQPIEFDLFVHLEKNDRYLKITKKDGKLFSNQKNKLISSGIKEMHIPKDQIEQLEKYKAQNFLNDNIKNYLNKKKKG